MASAAVLAGIGIAVVAVVGFGLILSVSPAANKSKKNDQFKNLMFANHPDRGGSPFIATKIKEAEDVLEK
ncbi:hypothetical protein HCN44_008020 [Aphidius gifuensis]|uniref:Uncharacterized protein n=1 Tax=Aphidius gifuensis TaxID=684658 RepID=A0A834XNM3_APHGI|nr:hypothetical protein HCN44_008020 [Aphidius gifuensis]